VKIVKRGTAGAAAGEPGDEYDFHRAPLSRARSSPMMAARARAQTGVCERDIEPPAES